MKVITEDLLRQSFRNKFDYVLSHKKILESSCVVFVYNSVPKYPIDDLHVSECIYNDEFALIRDSFNTFPNLKFIPFDNEESFFKSALSIKQEYKKVFVYSMAQDVKGTGRRCLIPLICEYYGFINISSNSRSSFLGGDKHLMFTLLDKYVDMPKRIFLDSIDKTKINYFRENISSDLLLKPNSESASIGVKKIDKCTSDNKVFSIVENAISSFDKIILEEFVSGEEIECTILRWEKQLYICAPVKIIKYTEFLDYQTVASDSYDFMLYQNDSINLIKTQALKAYNVLEFDSIARFDFILKDGKSYLFDITPNPTISSCSSASRSMHLIKNDDRTIYIALLLDKLLIPSLN